MSNSEELTMGPSPEPMDSAGADESVFHEPIDIADMPVEIRFEAGRIRLRYGELCKLQPGYTCELGHTLADQTIDITANGALVARGELVNIGDQLGVRITALARLRARA